MARLLDRSPSAVGREINRNDGYKSAQAVVSAIREFSLGNDQLGPVTVAIAMFPREGVLAAAQTFRD